MDEWPEEEVRKTIEDAIKGIEELGKQYNKFFGERVRIILRFKKYEMLRKERYKRIPPLFKKNILEHYPKADLLDAVIARTFLEKTSELMIEERDERSIAKRFIDKRTTNKFLSEEKGLIENLEEQKLHAGDILKELELFRHAMENVRLDDARKIIRIVIKQEELIVKFNTELDEQMKIIRAEIGAIKKRLAA